MRYMDTLGRSFTPGVIADIPTGNLLWVDAVNGNDDLAVRGRLTVPFQSLVAAKDAASAGDTICVMSSGSSPYTVEASLLKLNVDWYFLPGAAVTFVGTSGAMFDTTGLGSGKSRIWGYGVFQNSSSGSNAHVLYSNNSNYSVYLEAQSIHAVYKEAIRTVAQTDIKVIVKDALSSGVDVVALDGGGTETCFIKAHLIESSGGACLYVDGGSAELEVQRMYASTESVIYVNGGSGEVVVTAYEIHAQNDPAIHYDAYPSGPNLTIRSSRIKSSASSGGHAIEITGSHSKKLRLFACTLIAATSSDKAISASVASTKVLFQSASAGNYGLTNVTAVPSAYFVANSDIE